jgi:hypothetical protein
VLVFDDPMPLPSGANFGGLIAGLASIELGLMSQANSCARYIPSCSSTLLRLRGKSVLGEKDGNEPFHKLVRFLGNRESE